jgi:hypothetical protein
MTVIADFVLPAEEFVLSRTVTALSGIDIEIERLVAHAHPEAGITPYFHVTGDEADFDAVESALADDPSVLEVRTLEAFASERFYQVRWTGEVEGFMPALRRADAAVQSATYHDDRWELRLLFENRERLSAFYEEYSECGDIGLKRVFERSNPVSYGEFGLTEEQRDALVVALDVGYFAVPKQAEIADVAAELGVSPQAVSQRLRRAYANLVANTLGTPGMRH